MVWKVFFTNTVGSQRTPEVSEDEEDDMVMIVEGGVYGRKLPSTDPLISPVPPSSRISPVALIIPISDQPPFPRLATPTLTYYAFVTVATLLFANKSSPLALPVGPPFRGPLTHPRLVIAPPDSYPWHVFTIPFSSVLHL